MAESSVKVGGGGLVWCIPRYLPTNLLPPAAIDRWQLMKQCEHFDVHSCAGEHASNCFGVVHYTFIAAVLALQFQGIQNAAGGNVPP